jgi:hypothetical protein
MKPHIQLIVFACLVAFGHIHSRAQSEALPQQRPPRVRPRPQQPDKQSVHDSQWQPIIEMDGLVFPSLILATATMKAPPLPPAYVGDAFGLFGVEIISPKNNCSVDLTIRVDEIAPPSEYEATLPREGVAYEIFPPLEYRFERLRRVVQPFPINVVFKVRIDGGSLMTVARRAQVRPINECPFAWGHRDRNVHPQSWMFAAYVNEDHPWIDDLLREAINTGAVSQFVGYQGGQNNVYLQVFAIWDALQRRGFTYSNIATTSALSKYVFSERVRFLSDSIKTSQANCVDGSVLFASILRKIGLDVFLVLQPGHCFLGFWLDPQRRTPVFLETTMLGNTNLRQYSDDGTLSGSLAQIFGGQTKNQASYQSFVAAINIGLQEVQRVSPSEARNNPQYQIVDIARARQMGIAPLTW